MAVVSVEVAIQNPFIAIYHMVSVYGLDTYNYILCTFLAPRHTNKSI